MTKNIFNIEGKIALITGATGGLGSTFALGFAQNGATVILNGRNKEKLDASVNKLTVSGYKAYGFIFDVTDSNSIKKAVSQIEKEIGNIDILVNNAGINLCALYFSFLFDLA